MKNGVMKNDEIKQSFKPCFRWSAPYTAKKFLKEAIALYVLNLVLDGQLLIH